MCLEWNRLLATGSRPDNGLFVARRCSERPRVSLGRADFEFQVSEC